MIHGQCREQETVLPAAFVDPISKVSVERHELKVENILNRILISYICFTPILFDIQVRMRIVPEGTKTFL